MVQSNHSITSELYYRQTCCGRTREGSGDAGLTQHPLESLRPDGIFTFKFPPPFLFVKQYKSCQLLGG